MFQFTGFSSRHVHVGIPRLHRGGLPHSDTCGSNHIADPRSFSQLIASFIVSESLGIHHTLLFAFFLGCLHRHLLVSMMDTVHLDILYAYPGTREGYRYIWISFSGYPGTREGCHYYSLQHVNELFCLSVITGGSPVTRDFLRLSGLYLYTIRISIFLNER
jgi:hypothetical protein